MFMLGVIATFEEGKHSKYAKQLKTNTTSTFEIHEKTTRTKVD